MMWDGTRLDDTNRVPSIYTRELIGAALRPLEASSAYIYTISSLGLLGGLQAAI